MADRTSILARAPAALLIVFGAVIVGAVLILQGFTFLPVIGIFLGLAVMWSGVAAGIRVLRLSEPASARAPKAKSVAAPASLPAAMAVPAEGPEEKVIAFPVPAWIPSAGAEKAEPRPAGS
jgi:hypothetical protein